MHTEYITYKIYHVFYKVINTQNHSNVMEGVICVNTNQKFPARSSLISSHLLPPQKT